MIGALLALNVLDSHFDRAHRVLRNHRDYIESTNTTGLHMLTWDISGRFFPLNSTTFYYPRQQVSEVCERAAW